VVSTYRAEHMQNFEAHRERALLKYLSVLDNRDAVLSYHQIQGLLYAVVCSPEPVRAAEWFELIWLSDDPLFDDMAEAKGFFELLVELHQHIADAAEQDRYQPGLEA